MTPAPHEQPVDFGDGAARGRHRAHRLAARHAASAHRQIVTPGASRQRVGRGGVDAMGGAGEHHLEAAQRRRGRHPPRAQGAPGRIPRR